MNAHRNSLRGFALGLALLPALALADGRGELSENRMNLEYVSPAYFIPNVSGESGEALCEPGTPTCDVYDLTINFSDKWRADSKHRDAYVDLVYSWDASADYDLFLYDSNGVELASATNFVGAGGDLLTLPLELLPNGQYRIHAIPYLPNGSPASLHGAITGIASGGKNATLFAGALTPVLLFGLLALLGRRR